MFQFGDPWTVAGMYWDFLWWNSGPRIPQTPLMQQTKEEVEITLAYARMAYEFALKDLAGPETLEILLGIHDAAFARLGQLDEGYKDRIRGGKIQPPCSVWGKECLTYYYHLAGGVGNLTQSRRQRK